MITIKRLQVKGFKSLIDTNIEPFGDINMFYGFNNSGKSNVFKFLKLVFDRKKIGTKIKYNSSDEDSVGKSKSSLRIQTTNFWNGHIWNEPYLFLNDKRDKHIVFEIELLVSNDEFHNYKAILQSNGYLQDGRTTIKFVGKIVSIDFETSELRLTEAFLNDKRFYFFEDEIDNYFTSDSDTELTGKVGEGILNMFDDLVLLIDSDRNLTVERSQDGVEEFTSKTFKNALHELNLNAEKNERFNMLMSVLSRFDFSEDAKKRLGASVKSFPFNESTNLGFARFNEDIEIMLRNQTGRFPLRNYGTGIQQFLYILAKISQSNSKIIIVEELESNLSPLYQVELLRFLSSLRPSYDQLIFSSHSPFFTQVGSGLVDVIHHVQIGLSLDGGTSVESHDDVEEMVDSETGQSYFSLFFS